MCMKNAGNDSIDNGTDIADKVTIGLFDGNVAVENEKDDSSRSPFAMDNIDNEIKEDNWVQSENSETDYEGCENNSNESKKYR